MIFKHLFFSSVFEVLKRKVKIGRKEHNIIVTVHFHTFEIIHSL